MAPRPWGDTRSRSILAVLVPVLWLCVAVSAMAREPLRIFAAASTIAPVNAAAKLYSKQHGIRVVSVFASSGALARQLAAGAPGHLFLSADPKWMDWAQSRNAIAGNSRRVFLGNRLILAVRKGSGLKFKITKSLDLSGLLGDGRLAIADPAHAPLGAQARAALIWMGAWKKVARRALRFADAAQTRVMVERGEATFGILYGSDVAVNSRLEAAGVFPPDSHPPIRYEIAATRVAATDRATLSLLAWLSGRTARSIFAKAGFEVK